MKASPTDIASTSSRKASPEPSLVPALSHPRGTSLASLPVSKDDGEDGRELIAPQLQFHNRRRLWAMTVSCLSPQENTGEQFPDYLGVIAAGSWGGSSILLCSCCSLG